MHFIFSDSDVYILIKWNLILHSHITSIQLRVVGRHAQWKCYQIIFYWSLYWKVCVDFMCELFGACEHKTSAPILPKWSKFNLDDTPLFSQWISFYGAHFFSQSFTRSTHRKLLYICRQHNDNSLNKMHKHFNVLFRTIVNQQNFWINGKIAVNRINVYIEFDESEFSWGHSRSSHCQILFSD